MSDDRTNADEWTTEDTTRARERLDRHCLHQLYVYITHVSQLRGAFDTAYSRLCDYGIPAEQLKLWVAVDMGLTTIWGAANKPHGFAICKVGRLDAQELREAVQLLIGSLEKEHRDNLRRLLTAPPTDEDEMEDVLGKAVSISSALAFLGQIALCLAHQLHNMPNGRTPIEDVA